MSPKSATTLVSVVLLSSILTGCTQNQELVNPEPIIEETSWMKEGNTYTFDASYDNSAGTSEDYFRVTLDENLVVISAEATPKGESVKHAEGLARFNTDLKQVIVGKNLSELGEFDTLGKYSLTTDAFNDALKELQDQVLSNS